MFVEHINNLSLINVSSSSELIWANVKNREASTNSHFVSLLRKNNSGHNPINNNIKVKNDDSWEEMNDENEVVSSPG